jgi:hypothetical protein
MANEDLPPRAFLPRSSQPPQPYWSLAEAALVESNGSISNVGPAWFFAVCAEKVFDLAAVDAERIDELYHGTFFNEARRMESVKAHAALGGRLVHGCQSRGPT